MINHKYLTCRSDSKVIGEQLIFKSIKEFADFSGDCPFCGNKYSVNICGVESSIDNILRKQTMKQYKYLPEIAERTADTKYQDLSNQEIFLSEYTEDSLSFYNVFDGRKNKIFTIDINLNEFTYGNIENIQRILWEHHLFLYRQCLSEDCLRAGYYYRACTTLLVLGTLTSKIYPFSLDSEVITVFIKGQKFSLVNAADLSETFLLSEKDIVTKLPKFPLCSLRDEEQILKKIKLYILFS